MENQKRRFLVFDNVRDNCIKCHKRAFCTHIESVSPFKKRLSICNDCLFDYLLNIEKANDKAARMREAKKKKRLEKQKQKIEKTKKQPPNLKKLTDTEKQIRKEQKDGVLSKVLADVKSGKPKAAKKDG